MRDSKLKKALHFLLPSLSLKALIMEGELDCEPRIGGHNFAFLDELSPDQTCSICRLAMRSPVQTVCGHRFCQSCLLKAVRYCIAWTLYLMPSRTCISVIFCFSLDDINTVLFKMSAAKVERTKYSKLIVTGHENGDNKCSLISQLLKAASKPCKRERK